MAVRSNNLRTEAQGFYEHLGYKVTKTQNAFRKTPDVAAWAPPSR